ncbi:GPR1/FUN34/YaaH family transporter [[Mycoplasma] testudinis]|uniref:GPR1/FUN34/YaaH family transporter n=1 Tax=[Mycoplasma] testudinis TaxID=33924 RepID=UPI00047FCC88|nr:GPR1/FUN34/YaaH family transporter [[Mycoplasma] testudinis]
MIKKFEKNKKTFNWSAIGLLGFGVPTIVLSLMSLWSFFVSRQGFPEATQTGLATNLFSAALGFAFGCLLQMFAGIMSFIKKQWFTGTVFFAFAAFWLGFTMLQIVPAISAGATGNPEFALPNILYSLIWMLITIFFTIHAIREGNYYLAAVVGFLALFFGWDVIVSLATLPLNLHGFEWLNNYISWYHSEAGYAGSIVLNLIRYLALFIAACLAFFDAGKIIIHLHDQSDEAIDKLQAKEAAIKAMYANKTFSEKTVVFGNRMKEKVVTKFTRKQNTKK